MNCLSLCTGYGGLDLAVEEVFGATTTMVSEVDPTACAVIAERFTRVPNLGDLTAVDWTTVPPVDVLTAGYPCQPFSTAGRRLGANDVRHLWPFIADAIGVLRPRLVVLENVAGHLSMGAVAVLGDLARLGYDARWTVVRASDVGACHRRARLFVVATHADITGSEARSGRQGRGVSGRLQPLVSGGTAATDAERSGRSGGPRATWGDAGRRTPVGRAGEERCSECGCDEWMHDEGGFCAGCQECTDGGRRLPNSAFADAQHDGWNDHALRRGTGAGTDQGRMLEPEGRTAPPVWGAYGPAIARHAAVIGRPASHPVDDRGRLNPLFVEWMMMLPAGWVTDIVTNRSKALKCLGNGVVPAQAAYAIRLLASAAVEASA